MHFNKRKYLAAILSMVFSMSLLLNSFSIQAFALEGADTLLEQALLDQLPKSDESASDSLVENEASDQEQNGEMPAPAQDAASQPQTAAEDLTEQDEAQLQLKVQIADLLQQTAQVGQMTEQELETVQEQIQAVTAQPLAQQDEVEPDSELGTMLEQLANAQAAVEDMSMAYQAQREGWLDQLPQTGKENSWRYQNGERLEQPIPAAEATTVSLPEGVTTFSAAGYWGIDVSHHQGEVNWEAVKAAGIDFAIIRCGYGDDLVKQDDRQWYRNVAECERLGIPYGVYLYSYATDAAMAASEAAHTLRLLEGCTPDLPVFYDMEENRQLVLGTAGLAELARIYCDAVAAAGYDVGVYASLNWWQYYLTDSVFENWHRWVAEWRSSCTYTGRYEMWQYTDCGTINGISGLVDMNYWYGSLFRPTHPVAVEEGTYIIHSAVDYRYVLDMRNAGKENGVNAQLYASNDSGAQQFQIKSVGNGCYTFQNVNSGKLLDIQSGRMSAGTNVQQWEANGSNAQQWYFEDAGDGFYYIRAKGGQLYLDVAGGSASNGANVQIWTANQSAAQKFWLEKVEKPAEIQQGIYTIQAMIGSNMVLDISGGSSANGANAQLYSKNSSTAQQFVIYPVGQSYYSIRNVASGKVLDVKDGSMVAGANVQQWDWNGSKAQKWRFVDAGNGYYYIQSACNGLYLDVSGGSSKNGTNIQVYTANKSNAQKFKLVKFEGSQKIQEGVYTVQSALNASKVLDVLNASKANGGNIQIYSSNGTAAQKFKIESAGNGNYRIRNVNSGMVLDVASAGLDAGTNVQQWTWNGTLAQQWLFVDAGNGYYIQSACNGLYLDVSAGSTTNGTNVQVYTANQSTAQKFKLVKQ